MDTKNLIQSTYDKIADKYTAKYFDDMEDLYYLDIFLEGLPKDATILDVGCGPGQFSKYLRDEGHNITGIDISSRMLDIARKKVSGVLFKNMDMEDMTFNNETFDGLLAAYSLIHIPSKDTLKVLKEFKRVLRPGGKGMVVVQEGKADQIVELKEGEKVFVNFFTIERLVSLITSAGLNVEFYEKKKTADKNSLARYFIYLFFERPKK